MRIIAGKHKGRNLLSPTGPGIRPTSSKTRASMFNVLSSRGLIEDAIVLDLCCGTGALGLEALSRGAKKVIFIDGSAPHLKLAWENICQFKEDERSTLIRAKAEYLPKAKEKCDLVFIDPPYSKGVANKALVSLINGEWLSDNAMILIELAKQEDLIFSETHYREITTKIHGNSKFILLEKI